mmetsp:Transcript_72596/g.218032  ORF Transcript_72596/g.218032 Transcript_72596/m.218032 type:complete len:207 (+) Transcript_72596:97-717(+)
MTVKAREAAARAILPTYFSGAVILAARFARALRVPAALRWGQALQARRLRGGFLRLGRLLRCLYHWLFAAVGRSQRHGAQPDAQGALCAALRHQDVRDVGLYDIHGTGHRQCITDEHYEFHVAMFTVRWRLAAAENDSSACTSLQLFDLTRPCRECNRNIAPHQQIVPDDAACRCRPVDQCCSLGAGRRPQPAKLVRTLAGRGKLI